MRTAARLTDEIVRQIYRSDETNVVLGARYGVDPETVRQARAGITFAHLRPPPIPGKPSCYRCRHWRGAACDLGFPDPIEEGPRFAMDCAVYACEGGPMG
jgi:hypothetical protein